MMRWRTTRRCKRWTGVDESAILRGARPFGGVRRSAGATTWEAWLSDGERDVGSYLHRRDAKMAVELAACRAT